MWDANSSVMDFNYGTTSIWPTDIPLLAIADFSPSSEKLNSALSAFRLFLARLEKNVVLAEGSPSASVGAPAAASSSWASATHLASAASATAWCDESTGTDALLGLVTLSVAVILRFGRALSPSTRDILSRE